MHTLQVGRGLGSLCMQLLSLTMHGALTFVAYVEEGRGERGGEKEPAQPTIHCCRVRCTVCGVLCGAVCGVRCAICGVRSGCMYAYTHPDVTPLLPLLLLPPSSGTMRHRRLATRPTCSSSGRSGGKGRERKRRCVCVCVCVCVCGVLWGVLWGEWWLSCGLLQPRTAP